MISFRLSVFHYFTNFKFIIIIELLKLLNNRIPIINQPKFDQISNSLWLVSHDHGCI